MRYTPTAVALILSVTVLALPTTEQLDERDHVQTVHLTLHGGPTSYDMAFPADGAVYPTSTPLR